MGLLIQKLSSDSDQLVILASWFEAQWPAWYGPDGPGDALADLRQACSEALPITLIALDAQQRLLGSVSLKTESLGAELGYSPWAAALLVDPPRRGQGIGYELISSVEQQAAELGFADVFASTDTAAGILLKRGWKATGDKVKSDRGLIPVFRKALFD